jgi:hypothetical protein
MRTLRKERWLRCILAMVTAFLAVTYLRNLLSTVNFSDDVADSDDYHDQEPLRPESMSPPRVEITAEHIFMDDGLLEVNPGGIHPIYELIRRAEDGWRAKIGRASTTFPQAVAEYRRRYKRDPPKGFDDWCVYSSLLTPEAYILHFICGRWTYVQTHAVQLPDEYDQIHADLEPFWGIEPKDLLAIRAELEAKVDSYTLGKTATSQVDVVNASFAPGKYDQLIKGSENILDLLSDVEEFLPPFRAVFSPHDGPNRVSAVPVHSRTKPIILPSSRIILLKMLFVGLRPTDSVGVVSYSFVGKG